MLFETAVDPLEGRRGSGDLALEKGCRRKGDARLPPVVLLPETDEHQHVGSRPVSVGPSQEKMKAGPRHRLHRSVGEKPWSLFPDTCRSEKSWPPIVGGTIQTVELIKSDQQSNVSLQPEALDPGPTPPGPSWSPAVTERSTPPLELQQISPDRGLDIREFDGTGAASSDVSDEEYQLPVSCQNDRDSIGQKKGRPFHRVLRLLGLKRGSMKVGSVDSPPLSPHSFSAQPRVVPWPDSDNGSPLHTSRSLFHGGRGAGPAEQGVATGRVEVEVDIDIEEGREDRSYSTETIVGMDDNDEEIETGALTVRVGSRPVVAAAPAVSPSAQVATVPGVVEPAIIENGIVLPCAPSDVEKTFYEETGRLFLVTFGTVAFLAALTGMWLFTIASPFFFWFGAPTVFVMCYLVFHYFVVAVWGKDYKPEDHQEIAKKAVEETYLPTVDIFLPVCNEDIVLLRNTWKNVALIDYPHFTVHVLDDGAKDDVRDLAAEFEFQYIRRDNRPEMKKAGNLRYAFARTFGDAIAIFDADFCPRTDFLRETTPYLLNPEIGILQTPQYFRWRKEQTWVEQGAVSCQEFFYRMVQMNQDKFNGAVCVGSCGLYRRTAVEPFGGVAPISHSEDMYTGFKMTELGYKIKYLPLCLAMGICPDEPRSFFMQQYRWCMGSATIVFERGFWSADISWIHKICFINGLMYYIATALLIFLTPVPIIMLIAVMADGIFWYYSAFALPSILMVGVVLPLWAKQKYGMSCHRVRVIQCYAHLFALKDRILGTAAAWVPSGGGASSSSSKGYDSAVRVMIVWTFLSTFLIVGGSAWRMTQYPWYHFVPAIGLAVGTFCLNMSTIIY